MVNILIPHAQTAESSHLWGATSISFRNYDVLDF